MNTKSATWRASVTKHGMYSTPEYGVWKAMRERCNNAAHPTYKDYGARGIKVCEAWSSFEQFYADMGPRPSRLHQLDRVRNHLGYSKQNCRWATKSQNNRNTRRNVLVMFRGRKVTLAEAAEITGLNYQTLRARKRRGLTARTGLFAPVQGGRRA